MGCTSMPASTADAGSNSNLVLLSVIVLMCLAGCIRLRSGLNGYMNRVDRLSDLPVQMRVAVRMAPLLPGGSVGFAATLVAAVLIRLASETECQPWLTGARIAIAVSVSAFVYGVISLLAPGGSPSRWSALPSWWWRLRKQADSDGI